MPLSPSDAVRAQLAGAVIDAHSLAGWAAYDIADTDQSLVHFGRALTYREGATPRAARIPYTVAKTELNFGDLNHALKLLQLAQLGLEDAPQPQPMIAFVLAVQARAYATLVRRDKASDLLRKAFDTYAAADQAQDWRQEQLSSIAGGLELASGNWRKPPPPSPACYANPHPQSRTVAVDLTRLATVYFRIGEIDRGMTIGDHALNAVAVVPGSVRLTQRLIPLRNEAASRRNASCQDLARAVRMYLNR